ncbi:MAG: hypothetical protein LAP86_31525 [Acidobacteriia bacterium]|nr:hypothetical protein [Terriglobia bacterium]
MKSAKALTGRREKSGSNTSAITSIEFVLRAELHEPTETDFVHSINGRIIAESQARGEEDAGYIRASLIQFSEALDHGISAERLGDGISGDIAEYWEHLFDPETGHPKEEIQNEFEAVDLDLLIIDQIVIHPEFRGLGIAESAVHRMIGIFGTACGLVACRPWPLQFTPSIANDPKALRQLAFPDVSEGEAIRKLRSFWSRLGFWPIRSTGIYVMSRSQRACEVSFQYHGKSHQ